jgi:hypothetical protein
MKKRIAGLAITFAIGAPIGALAAAEARLSLPTLIEISIAVSIAAIILLAIWIGGRQ